MAADTEARALAMTWMGLTVSLGASSDVVDVVRAGSGGDWVMGSRSRRSESPRLPAGPPTAGAPGIAGPISTT